MAYLRTLIELKDPAWLRQPGESARNYVLFKKFRGSVVDEPAEDGITTDGIRNVAKLAREIAENYNTISSMSNRMRWRERCDAYDAYLDDMERQETEAQLKKLSRGWARQRIDRANGLIELAEALKLKALKIAKDKRLYIKSTAEQVVETYPDGRVKTLVATIYQPAGWRHRDAGILGTKMNELLEAVDRLMSAQGADVEPIQEVPMPSQEAAVALDAIIEYRRRLAAEREAAEGAGDGDDDEE